MSRRATITQYQITKAIKAAVAAGVVVAKIEVDELHRKTTIYPEGFAGQGAPDEWDEALE
ncbi:hypothetical protein [Roseovarius mucosus]|uniref:hypothetical protein n=1 Tax=Roseovarius mucosus TaxID=215743 RepID=UPI003F6FE9C3